MPLRLEALENRVLLTTNTWTSSVGGSWQTPGDWSLGHTPTTGEDVVIPQLSGTQTITYSSGTSTIQSLTTSDNVDLSGGTLDVTGTIKALAGQLALQGATLGEGTIDADTTLLGQSGTLDGVTINGNLQVVGDNGVVVADGLTLNGTATLGGSGGSNWGYLDFNGSQTLGGTGTVTFTGPGPYNALALSSGTLTIGPGITVGGQSGYLGYSPYLGGSPTVVNQGTLEWADGGNILVYGTLTNDGTITVDSTSTMATGGTIAGGTITTQDGAGIANETLDGVTIDGDFQVVGGNAAGVTGGLTLDGTATLGGSSTFGYLEFSGSQTLGGTGTVVFSGTGPYNALGVASGTLTIGPGITVRGQSGYVGYSPEIGGSPTVDNQGTIQADVSGGTITVNGTGDQNTGTLKALDGGTLSLQGSNWDDSGVNYADATSAFSIGASFSNDGNTLALTGPGAFTCGGTIQGGTLSVAAGTTLDLDGTLDGVTIDGNFQVIGGNNAVVKDGLTLNGTATLGGSGGATGGTWTSTVARRSAAPAR